MFEGLSLPWQEIHQLAFLFNFRTTSEVPGELYFVEICLGEVMAFNNKRADSWLPNFGRSLLSLLNPLQHNNFRPS